MNQLLRGSVVAAIRGYQLALSPILGARCRYIPSCSEYALTAVQRFGVIKGTGLAAARLCRCHPWGGSGLDEVPDRSDH